MLLISKACELFIMESAFIAWLHSRIHEREIIREDDVAGIISHVSAYSFLQGRIKGAPPGK